MEGVLSVKSRDPSRCKSVGIHFTLMSKTKSSSSNREILERKREGDNHGV
jgi:hypothetical protein